MENPYSNDPVTGKLREHNAWDKGYGDGWAEQAEVVNELVKALREYITYGHLETTELGRRAWEKARTVIAKATGI